MQFSKVYVDFCRVILCFSPSLLIIEEVYTYLALHVSELNELAFFRRYIANEK